MSKKTKNIMTGLPKGFYEVVGEDAASQSYITDAFFDNGYSYGFQLAFPCEVGFQNTYLSFGTAARDRCYCFEDMGDNQLILSPDSLATCIRLYNDSPQGGENARIMAVTPVYRYQRKKYRRFHHLIYSMFQEADDLNASLTLLLCANSFLQRFYGKLSYQIKLYGIFEAASEFLGFTHEEMFDDVYKRYSGKPANNPIISNFLQCIEDIGKRCEDWEKAFENISECYPYLDDTLKKYDEFLQILAKQKISFYVNWSEYSAVEYSSGICFLIKDVLGIHTLADGGCYNYVVNKSNPSIQSCYSFACSLEDFPIIKKLAPPIIYMIRLDCSVGFFIAASEELRNRGFCVYDIVVEKSVKKTLKELPPRATKIVIGKKEENAGRIQLGADIMEVVL